MYKVKTFPHFDQRISLKKKHFITKGTLIRRICNLSHQYHRKKNTTPALLPFFSYRKRNIPF